MDLQAQLQALLDRQAISELVSRYFWALDRKDWEALRACLHERFSLDGMDVTGREPVYKPAAQFVDEVRARNGGFAGSLHCNPNHVVDLAGDTAVVRAYMLSGHWVGRAPEDALWGCGAYRIVAVRAAAGWRLERVSIEVWYDIGDTPRVFALAAARLGGAVPPPAEDV